MPEYQYREASVSVCCRPALHVHVAGMPDWSEVLDCMMKN